MSESVYKVGCRLGNTGLVRSIYTPPLSSFTRLYRLRETITASEAPVFAFQDRESALAWYQRMYWRLQQKDLSLVLYAAQAPATQPPPPFLPPSAQWPLWEEFWWRWHEGGLGVEDEWCGPGERVLRPPKGTVICRQITLTERIDVRALLGNAFFWQEKQQ